MSTFAEPTWAATGQPTDMQAGSTAFQRDPFMLTGLFMQFARAHYYVANNIRNDNLKGYLWNEDTTLSKILIEPSYAINLKNVQQRPAILVKRAGYAFRPMGMGGGKHTYTIEAEGRLKGYVTGGKYTSVVSGTHELLCIGMTGSEADLLAVETGLHFLEYQDVLKMEGALGKFIVDTTSPLQKMDENQENWLSIIKLDWAYTHNWTLSQDAPVFKKLSLDSTQT